MAGREYEKPRALVESLGGTTEYRPRPPGGDYVFRLYGLTFTVAVPDDRVNVLDYLYVPKTAIPRYWEDFKSPAQLVPGWEMRMLTLIQTLGKEDC